MSTYWSCTVLRLKGRGICSVHTWVNLCAENTHYAHAKTWHRSTHAEEQTALTNYLVTRQNMTDWKDRLLK